MIKSITSFLFLETSNDQKEIIMDHVHTLHHGQVDTLLLLGSEGLPLTQKSYREAKRECFQTKLTFPNGFSGLPNMKDTTFVVNHSESPDYFSISNSPFIFLRAMKTSGRATEIANATIKCFTINECHFIFTPNISINLTAGMPWLLIAEGMTGEKKRHKGGIFFPATPISGETVWKGFALGTKSQEKFVLACSHSMGLKHHPG